MHKIDFGKKLEKLNKKRESKSTSKYKPEHFRQSLRYKKLIAQTIKLIINKNDKRLSNEDIKSICLSVYNKYDKTCHIRVRETLNQDIVKNDINSELQRILTDKGIKPLEKVVFHAEKASDSAKSTSDHIQTARFFRELADIQPVQTTETREFKSFSDYKDNKPSKIKQTVTAQIPQVSQNETENEAIRDVEGEENKQGNDNI